LLRDISLRRIIYRSRIWDSIVELNVNVTVSLLLAVLVFKEVPPVIQEQATIESRYWNFHTSNKIVSNHTICIIDFELQDIVIRMGRNKFEGRIPSGDSTERGNMSSFGER